MTDDDPIITGPRLREMRRRKGWSQEGLARRLRVSLSTVRNWEAGRVVISPSRALALRMLFTPPTLQGGQA